MKKILRHFVIATFTTWVISQIASGMVFEEGFKTLIIAGACVALTSFLAKPIINLLLLPLNLVTFGLFRWLSSAVVFYIATLIIEEFKITEFSFSGHSTPWFDIPSINLKLPFAFVGFSFLYSLIASSIYWLRK